LEPLPGLRRFEVTKQRLEHVMRQSADFRARMPRPYWLLMVAGLLLLGPGARLAKSTDGQPPNRVQQNQTTKQLIVLLDEPKSVGRNGAELELERQPQLIESDPKAGETEVSADLKEIRVTFDCDMERGMSWTGGPPYFPPLDQNRKARWINSRTCVLPVKLETGRFYRVGINSKSHRNFRCLHGGSAAPTVLCFATAGAAEDIKQQLKVPRVLTMDPPNGAADVDPTTETLRVTFDMPMGGGMSWTGAGPGFPTLRRGLRAHWSSDGKTCILPVALEPGHSYRLKLNNGNAINFQSESGVPLAPVGYEFKTGPAAK
jgi:RNA polymerase sigma-70 factor (ECF subfamily)